MKYKVREDCCLTWPDGSVWAEGGDVVELHDDIEPPAAAALMQALAAQAGARRACYRAEDGDEAKPVELPAAIVQALVNRGWVAEEPQPVTPRRVRRKKPVTDSDTAE
jgi:hypothetical protein